MVDEFQHIVYEHPELTPAERKQAWSRLEREYKPHLDYEGDPFFGQGGFWQKQLHIYDYPLYYIDYCLAQTCALQYKGEDGCRFYRGVEELSEAVQIVRQRFLHQYDQRSRTGQSF